MPPRMPEGLGSKGRSRMLPSGGRLARFRQFVTGFGWPARIAVALGLVAAVSLPLQLLLNSRVTPVQFEQPETSYTVDISLPEGVSRSWLVQEIKQSVGQQLGELYVIGAVGASPPRVLYSSSVPVTLPTRPEQVFGISLRCEGELCVLALNRRHNGSSFSSQGVMFADMPMQQWRDTVRNTTLSLFP